MPVWVKPVDTWIQVSGNFYKVLSTGFALTAGTPVELTLPNAGLLTEFSFIRMDLGDSDMAVNESLWVPRERIAVSPTNGVVLVADTAVPDSLYTVNVLSGAASIIGPLGITNPFGMTSHNGVVLVADTAVPASLYTVNVLSGAASIIGPLGITNPRAMTSHNGVVLVADASTASLYTVNVLSGAASIIGPLGITNPSAMTSHNVGGNFFRVSHRVGLLRDGQTELIIYPQNDGYCHAVLGIP